MGGTSLQTAVRPSVKWAHNGALDPRLHRPLFCARARGRRGGSERGPFQGRRPAWRVAPPPAGSLEGAGSLEPESPGAAQESWRGLRAFPPGRAGAIPGRAERAGRAAAGRRGAALRQPAACGPCSARWPGLPCSAPRVPSPVSGARTQGEGRGGRGPRGRSRREGGKREGDGNEARWRGMERGRCREGER